MLRALCFFLLTAANLDATLCSTRRPCEQVRPTSILFTGTVLAAEDLHDADLERNIRYHMTLREIFNGLPGDTREVTIETGRWMQLGKDYLLDAYRNPNGSFSPAPCGASQPLNESDDFLRYLQARSKGEAPTSLTIRVEARDRGVAGAEVVIRGPAGERHALTDAAGNAFFEPIPAGVYTVAASRPSFHEPVISVKDARVQVADQACASAGVILQSDASISGSLRLPGGAPAANLKVELIAVGPEGPTLYPAVTGDDGDLTFVNVFPGRYLLGTSVQQGGRAPRAWYPGRTSSIEATEILVEPGAKIEGLQFDLPDVGPRRIIRIRVVEESGKPVNGALVSDRSYAGKTYTGRFGTLGNRLVTDADGWVKVEGFEAATYTVNASTGPSLQNPKYSDDVEIPPGKGPLTLQLIVRPHPVRR